jgi:hypothetical protein
MLQKPKPVIVASVSTRLVDALKEYLVVGRTDGFLFQTSEGNPWDASNVLVRKLNKVLRRLEIPKIDNNLLAKMVGKDRTVAQATRSEKRAASLGFTPSATRMQRRWTRWESRNRFASNASGTAVAVLPSGTRTRSCRMSAWPPKNSVNCLVPDGRRRRRE